VPENYIRISSGLGEATPQAIIVLPVLFEGQVNAVIELASFSHLADIHQVFLDQLTESIGIVINTIAAGMRTETLLTQSQSLTQELQSQQEELRETNERLERQAATLRESEERLRQQQEELRQTNDQLGEKAKLLEIKNREVEFAKEELEEKAEQLALTSKYKSEFLANMSHELRTPLNSLLILSRMLSDNAEGNLTSKQVEFSRTIHGSGTDLLALINDILDLSKIESGTMTVDANDVPFTDLRDYVEQNFRHVAQQKSLEFAIELFAGLPRAFITDPKRLQQILKNLLSNAFKFTERGRVTLECRVVTEGWSREHEILGTADMVLAFSVIDTGIGIPQEKQRIIFEAFQQADGTTSRRYGGTGLGLSISRELSRLLGGEIRVTSASGRGSTFTLFLPRQYVPVASLQAPARRIEVIDATRAARSLPPAEVLYPRGNHPPQLLPAHETTTPAGVQPALVPLSTIVADDRESIVPGDRVLLVIEDDAPFARIVADRARAAGFKVVVAPEGDIGLAMARRLKPSAITLDLRLPDIDGWTVLDQLKHDTATRHIPVNIVSADDQRQRGLKMGAFGYLQKPTSAEAMDTALGDLAGFVNMPSKNLLVVEDDEGARQSIMALIGNHADVRTTAVGSGKDALAALREGDYRCMVLDLGLPDMTGFELLQKIKRQTDFKDLPIIVYTGKDLTKKEETQLKRLAETVIIKDVKSPQRLLDETSLFLHLNDADLSDTQKRMLAELHQTTPLLAGARVLVIDDDVRNIFAVTSALERHHANVVFAENGKDGLAMLEKNPDIDVVLTDIMMPGMDGYEVMQRIRAQDRFKNLPIIAITAKAMRADREKCIQAGASDYIAKPVDMDQLLSLLRVWLYR
jgi:CheY-like chemotaxis protein/GAF domain-containing protein